jgi:hypothetical protein
MMMDGQTNPYLIHEETDLDKGEMNTVLVRLGRAGTARDGSRTVAPRAHRVRVAQYARLLRSDVTTRQLRNSDSECSPIGRRPGRIARRGRTARRSVRARACPCRRSAGRDTPRGTPARSRDLWSGRSSPSRRRVRRRRCRTHRAIEELNDGGSKIENIRLIPERTE